MFNLKVETLKQLRTVYKVAANFEVQFAASFFAVEIDMKFTVWIELIKTKEKYQRKGFAAEFIRDLVEFGQEHVDGCSRLNGGDILVGQSQILRPHGFFQKQSFGPLPERL